MAATSRPGFRSWDVGCVARGSPLTVGSGDSGVVCSWFARKLGGLGTLADGWSAFVYRRLVEREVLHLVDVFFVPGCVVRSYDGVALRLNAQGFGMEMLAGCWYGLFPSSWKCGI